MSKSSSSLAKPKDVSARGNSLNSLHSLSRHYSTSTIEIKRSRRDESPDAATSSPLRKPKELLPGMRQDVVWYNMPVVQRWYSGPSSWLQEDRYIRPTDHKDHKSVEKRMIQVNLDDLSLEGCIGQRTDPLDTLRPGPCGSRHGANGKMYSHDNYMVVIVSQVVWLTDGSKMWLATTCIDKTCVANARQALLEVMKVNRLAIGPFSIEL